MKKQIIPIKEQQNVLDVFWALLLEAEGRCRNDPIADVMEKLIVRAGYNVLNRIEFTENRPRWEPNENTNNHQ